MSNTELTITRVVNDTGPDSFWVKGKLGRAFVGLQQDGLWHIDQQTGGDVRQARTDRDTAMMCAIHICSTVLKGTYY